MGLKGKRVLVTGFGSGSGIGKAIARTFLEEVARTIVSVSANKAANGSACRIEGGIVRSIL